MYRNIVIKPQAPSRADVQQLQIHLDPIQKLSQKICNRIVEKETEVIDLKDVP